ncbi:unnamed protein product [Kuraishia capsulata CBS 1993]|uniref:JmjC domain-containing protein n=1 Tax=Kuraishia capsulata CBS 1993 TaxID=1382522 RepID=W6MW37_9ASCO|nr:uncharacterized protein KUCA_T00002829001 [Kuraishia capsulata CBS 1993]CDK26855.1 unnamed protein product [Kuraishia capsulata CBS 1993]
MTTQKRLKSHKSDQQAYLGYCVSPGDVIDTVDLAQISQREFASNYIFSRKPCILRSSAGLVPLLGQTFSLDNFKSGTLLKTLDCEDGKQTVQIELKSDGGFGSGKKRIKMSLKGVLEAFKNNDSSIYLTTQYGNEEDEEDEDDKNDKKYEQDQEQYEDDDDDDEPEHENEQEEDQFFGPDDNVSDSGSSIDFNEVEDDYDDRLSVSGQEPMTLQEAESRCSDLFQPPLTCLLTNPDILPLNVKLFEALVPQQVNLWMGLTAEETSSSAFQADLTKPDLGLGKRVPFGTSSGLHHDHSDNLYIPVTGCKRFTVYSPSEYKQMYTVGRVNQLYNSGVIDYHPDERAPNWRTTNADGSMTDCNTYEENLHESGAESALKCDQDPPSFSRVPPLLANIDQVSDPEVKKQLTDVANVRFPGFLDANSLKIELNPGDALYLPAGWFHEVTSTGDFQDEIPGIHTAINYWFAPPDGTAEKPYTTPFWRNDFARTARAIDERRTK